MPVNIPIVSASAPVTTEPVATKVFDTWFLKDFKLYSTADRTFNASVSWQLGKIYEDGSSELSNQKGFVLLEDILSDTCLQENPEIAAIVPTFLSALEAISRRKNAIK
jgi:hypothetical protein